MDASNRITETLAVAVFRLIRPLVRILLRHGMSFNEFSELAKRVYVDVALGEFRIPGKKQTISRVSILTGLTRKEVQRLCQTGTDTATAMAAAENYNRAARVISGWVRDKNFTDTDGDPLVLPLDDATSSFTALVRKYSGDMPARAVLDELLRVGAAERLADDRIRLVTRAYVPRTSELDKLAILGTDVSDLIATIDHNLEHGSDDPRFQRKVMYDNLPVKAVDEFRRLSSEQAQKLIEAMDQWLSRHDRDENPDIDGSGRMRAGIGVFYFEENLAVTPEENAHDLDESA
jgi:hypothetical protein